LGWALLLLAIPLEVGWSQDNSAPPQAAGTIDDSGTQPVVEPDTSQVADSSPTTDANNPSIDGGTRLFASSLGAGLHVTGGGQGYFNGMPGSPEVQPVSSFLGSLDLQKLWRRSQTTLDYVGGATFNGSYGSAGAYVEQLHSLDVSQRFSWHRTQVVFRDAFNFLRDGNFGSSSFGGASAYNLRFGENGEGAPGNTEGDDYLGGTSLGQESFITNVAAASITEALNKRSSISVDGAYSISDYSGYSQSLSNDRQITGQLGYKYRLNRRDSISVVYSYQRFQYTLAGVGVITTNSARLVYRHRLLTRLDLVLGGGPEVTKVAGSAAANGSQLNATAQASLQYRKNNYNLGFSYDRLETGGFGVFAGGNSNIFRLSMGRALSRTWRVSFDGGYAASTSIENSPGVPASSYDYDFAGGAIRRQWGPRLSAFGSYQFNWENSPCGPATSCPPGIQQHIVSIGIDWNIRPIHLE